MPSSDAFVIVTLISMHLIISWMGMSIVIVSRNLGIAETRIVTVFVNRIFKNLLQEFTGKLFVYMIIQFATLQHEAIISETS